MSDELRVVNGKLDDTMSLLLVQRNQHLLEPQSDGSSGGGGGGGGSGGGVTSFGSGNMPANFHGAPAVRYMSPRFPIDRQHQHQQQEQGWPGHQFYPQQFQQPSHIDRYPGTPYEVSGFPCWGVEAAWLSLCLSGKRERQA